MPDQEMREKARKDFTSDLRVVARELHGQT